MIEMIASTLVYEAGGETSKFIWGKYFKEQSKDKDEDLQILKTISLDPFDFRIFGFPKDQSIFFAIFLKTRTIYVSKIICIDLLFVITSIGTKRNRRKAKKLHKELEIFLREKYNHAIA